MRDYDPTQPLIFVHVPKTAGISVRTIFKDWFADRLCLNYYNEVAGTPPVIYGHFSRNRAFGVKDFVTTGHLNMLEHFPAGDDAGELPRYS